VTRWARSARTDAAAEAPAVCAVLVTERARLAHWALIDDACPRRSRRNQRRWSRMATTPRSLAARRGAEALPTNPAEPPPAHSAGGRRSVIVMRPDLRLHDQPPEASSVAPLPCQRWPEPTGRCRQT